MYGTGISQEVGNGGQVCGDMETVGFPVQNVHKITYGDENATFEPLNLLTHERLQYLFIKSCQQKIEAEMNLTELQYFPYV